MVEVSTSLYRPPAPRNWRARSTPTTATATQIQGPRKIRLTSITRGDRPDLLTPAAHDISTVHALPTSGRGFTVPDSIVHGALFAVGEPLGCGWARASWMPP